MRARSDAARLRHLDEWRRSAQRTLFAGTLAFLAIVTVSGVVVALREADQTLERRAELTSRRAAAGIMALFDDVTTSLGGAAATVDATGALDLEVFRTFAEDVIGSGAVTGIGLVGVVPGSERAAAETAWGRPFTAVVDGELVPAPRARVHYPLLAVEPGDAVAPEALGYDFAADPAREGALTQAATERRAVISEQTEFLDGRPGVLVVRPLYATGEESTGIVGFTVSGVDLGTVLESARRSVGAGVDVAVVAEDADGDRQLLVGDELIRREISSESPVPLPGALWTVAVHDPGGADRTLALLVGSAGGVGIIAVAALLLVTERNQRNLERSGAQLEISERRTRAVQGVASQLAHALTGEEVIQALLDHLPAAVGAHSAVLAVQQADGSLTLYRGDGTTERAELARGAGLARHTLQTGEAQWLRSPFDWRDDATTVTLAGDASAVALLALRERKLRGLLAVAYDRYHIFSEDEQELMGTVAVLAGRALARGRQYDAEHHAAFEFQRSALPDDLPEVAGLSVAARYQPAEEHAMVGGDWYDVFPLADGQIILAVGDVVGHGITAAATMGRLRTVFRALAPMSSDPSAMLAALDRHAGTIPGSTCSTIVCAVVDPGASTVTWSRSGHLPPLVITADGPRMLEHDGGPPLGVIANPDPPAHVLDFSPGDVLVLYTDGLVERRGESIDLGFDRLVRAAAGLHTAAPDDVADALLAADIAPPVARRDDIAVLVARLDR